MMSLRIIIDGYWSGYDQIEVDYKMPRCPSSVLFSVLRVSIILAMVKGSFSQYNYWLWTQSRGLQRQRRRMLYQLRAEFWLSEGFGDTAA